jgi:hypothetical protein
MSSRHPKRSLRPVPSLRDYLAEVERHDLAAARAALAQVQREGTVPWEKVKADVMAADKPTGQESQGEA